MTIEEGQGVVFGPIEDQAFMTGALSQLGSNIVESSQNGSRPAIGFLQSLDDQIGLSQSSFSIFGTWLAETFLGLRIASDD